MTSLFIQVPAFEEADVLADTLQEINDQPVPDGVSVTKQVWVTRSEDRRGVCTTWQAGTTVAGWDVLEAPRGKLSARNRAHNHALDNGADLICAWDADAPPRAERTLAALVGVVSQPGVALANSNPVARDGSLLGVGSEVASKLEDSVAPHVHGQCHVMTAEAWRQAGPFDTDLDQTSIGEVRAEEEFAFRRRVAEVGEVVDVSEARVFNDPRRNACRLPNYEDPFCERIGDNTF
jgi:hypothetical protein